MREDYRTKARSIRSDFPADRFCGRILGTGKRLFRSLTGCGSEVFWVFWNIVITQFFQPVQIGIQDLHGTPWRKSQTGIAEIG